MGDYIKKTNNYVSLKNGKKRMFASDDLTYNLGNTQASQDNTSVKKPNIQSVDPTSVKPIYRSYIKKLYLEKSLKRRIK